VIYPFGSKPLQDLKENERIGIRSWDINLMINLDWKAHKNKLVLLQPVSFQNKTYFNLPGCFVQ
jgi:DNA polymerase-3 subunit alpha